jgi:hypothetical protein
LTAGGCPWPNADPTFTLTSLNPVNALGKREFAKSRTDIANKLAAALADGSSVHEKSKAQFQR